MTRATVREVDGRLVLDDPDALAVARAVAKHNCRGLAEANAERVAHFVGRVEALRRDDLVIVVINVDDPNGGLIADALMPGHDWQAYRDRGELPIARGLAARAGVALAVATFDADAAEKLHDAAYTPLLVVDHGVAEVFDARAVRQVSESQEPKR